MFALRTLNPRSNLTPFAPQPGWIKKPGRQGVALAYVNTLPRFLNYKPLSGQTFCLPRPAISVGLRHRRYEFPTSQAIEEKSPWTTLGGISPWSTLGALTARMQNWLADWEAWAAGYVFRPPNQKTQRSQGALPALYCTVQFIRSLMILP